MKTIKEINRFIKDHLPSWIYIPYLKMRTAKKWIPLKTQFEKQYHENVERLSKTTKPINVVFFAIEATNWKYDYLYWKLERDPAFNVSVLVCQEMDVEYDTMIDILERCYKMCVEHGYNVIKSYDSSTNTVIDPQTLCPDIIFYCNPYSHFFNKGYFMDSFPKSLICYCNYSYEIIPFSWAYTGYIQNLAWKYFCESNLHEKMIKAYSPVKGWNTVVSGYPMLDTFLRKDFKGAEWKIKDRRVKRIVWAPHQSIQTLKMSHNQIGVQFSTFLLFYDLMLELAQKYSNQIQIAFKPHPKLIVKLYNHPDWGKERTDAYYKKWKEGINTCYVSSDYVDLFATSDALIHDSGSFTAEYLCTQNPCMYLSVYMNDSNMNTVGKQAFRCHYQGKKSDDIESFITDVVINGNDRLKVERKKFYDSYLLPPNGLTASDNIVKIIKKELQLV